MAESWILITFNCMILLGNLNEPLDEAVDSTETALSLVEGVSPLGLTLPGFHIYMEKFVKKYLVARGQPAA
jgi:hypothetical protein